MLGMCVYSANNIVTGQQEIQEESQLKSNYELGDKRTHCTLLYIVNYQLCGLNCCYKTQFYITSHSFSYCNSN